MAEETKKVSFGFSKLKKPNILVKPVEISKPQVDYVDSFDGTKGKFSYKGSLRLDEPVKKELVIPLIGTRTALDVIRSKLEENKKDQERNNEKTEVAVIEKANGTDAPIGKEESRNKEKIDSKVQLSIDDLAAKEIINDLQNSATQETASSTKVIKQPSKAKIVNEKDAPIDYENIPVNDFGLAMLRGMGWTPETGIGKEQRVVQVVTPKLRPKGLGLGADKVILQQAIKDSDLIIAIKSYVKFSNGLWKGKYGQVESMDEDNGRVIVKLALGGTVSASEMLVMPVAKKEYDKNSKVLNPTTYESFKEPDRELKGKDKSDVDKSSAESSRKKHDDNLHRKEKYDRREARDRDRHSEKEEEEEENGRGNDRGRARHSSSSSSDRRTDHKKKKKQTRDDSAERKHKKSKKKRKKRRKYSSDEEDDNAFDGKYERDSSRNYSRSSKSKKSSYR